MNSDGEYMGWEDVSEAATGMFRVWNGDGAIMWVEECWRYLTEAGLTANNTVLEATETSLRLIMLARIYEEFCSLMWGENPETPISFVAEDLGLDPLALGIIAARTSGESFDETLEQFELYEHALSAASEAKRAELFQCLYNAYDGEIGLYSRMSKTNHSTDAEDDEDEFYGTFAHADAFAYVKNGFRYG